MKKREVYLLVSTGAGVHQRSVSRAGLSVDVRRVSDKEFDYVRVSGRGRFHQGSTVSLGSPVLNVRSHRQQHLRQLVILKQRTCTHLRWLKPVVGGGGYGTSGARLGVNHHLQCTLPLRLVWHILHSLSHIVCSNQFSSIHIHLESCLSN